MATKSEDKWMTNHEESTRQESRTQEFFIIRTGCSGNDVLSPQSEDSGIPMATIIASVSQKFAISTPSSIPTAKTNWPSLPPAFLTRSSRKLYSRLKSFSNDLLGL